MGDMATLTFDTHAVVNAIHGAVLFGGYETMKAWRNRPLQVA